MQRGRSRADVLRCFRRYCLGGSTTCRAFLKTLGVAVASVVFIRLRLPNRPSGPLVDHKAIPEVIFPRTTMPARPQNYCASR